MPSPFPGMNPYVEQDDAWHDFHEKFLPAFAERLVPQVRPHYIVKLDEHVYVHELPPEPRRLAGRADILVGQRGEPGTPQPGIGLLDAPAHVLLPTHDIERVAFLEIRDRRSRELVTVVELLSPANKCLGGDREQYLAKRETLLGGRVHLVEIDLLRGGRPLPSEGRPECEYSVLVSRADARPVAGFWPIRLRERLPVIPVPLRYPAEEARIDLQEILDAVYDASGYEDYIYDGAPDPLLSAADAAWASSFLPRSIPPEA